MQLDPLLQTFVDAVNGAEPPRVPEDRATMEEVNNVMFAQFGEPAPPVADVRELEIVGPDRRVRARLYHPGGDEPLPGYMFLFGGGWWHGSIDMAANDAVCRERCVGARCVVLAVDYRLAPEHPFPAGLEDAYLGLTWLVDHAAELGIDPQRVAIGGGSAGASLTAGLALLSRDRGGPRAALQILEAPALDLTLSQPSVPGICASLGIDRKLLTDLVALYVPRPEDLEHAYASPLFAESVADVPPALIMVCEHDVLRESGEAYATRLVEAGVPASCVRYCGQLHTSPLLTGVLPAARVWREQVIGALRGLHEEGPRL
ncbi:MAG TPA: alpha/beta hydrolase [Baekduia sp.]|uniref:alpha/beta hydrolase n=1 Tax=Baekduia sp. TaxID=2600305 RepID=UPI002BCAC26D|nr:alpha/beta hydrolase [Baekduia sp.]HMJ36707.1 alpha/beta hydrolase [Baekduia sp.]